MARTFNVTSTVNTDCVEYLSFNVEGITKESLKINFKADERITKKVGYISFKKETTNEDVLKGIRNKLDSTAVAILDRYTVSALYGMTEEDFYKISWILSDTDSRRDLITRTMKACMATVQVFDMTKKEMTFTQVPMDTGFDKMPADKQLALVRKKIETAELVPLAVTGCETREELRGTTKEKFISKATPLNPDTRQPFGSEESDS